MFLTGINEWRRHEAWPAKTTPLTLHLAADGRLSASAPEQAAEQFDEYVSDPNRPVPYVGYIAPGMTSDYMTEDQRFAAQRPDVLVYQTEALESDLVVAGPVRVDLHVSTSGTDADSS
jgi:predicted acyl esterase